MEEKLKCAYVDEEDAATDSVCEIECPHCHAPRDVEPDAHYVCECEECGQRYRVVGAC